MPVLVPTVHFLPRENVLMEKNYPLPAWRQTRVLLAGAMLSLCGLAGPVHAQAPANDEPCGALTLNSSGQLCTAPTVGTLQAATFTTPNGYANLTSCGGTFGQPIDVWYKFTTTSSGLSSTGVTISVTGNAAAQVRLFSAASCAGPFTEMGCQGATTPNASAPTLVASALTPGTTYYVRVATNNTGPFTICLTDGPGVVPCTPLGVLAPVYTNPDNTAATVTFVASSTHVPPFAVVVRQYVGTSFVVLQQYTSPTVAPVVLTGLVPGQRYEVQVQAVCPAGGFSRVSSAFTVPAPNDDPCGAYPLLVDPGAGCNPVAGTANSATPTIPNGYTNPGCSSALFGSAPLNDVWYSFRTAATGPASTGTVITLGNTSSAGQLRLFAAPTCGGPLQEVGCTAAQFGQAGPVALTATNLLPNTRYFVSVALLNATNINLNADFTICASVLPPAVCATLASIGLAPVFIRPTLATLGIRLAAGSRQPLSYAVTYTATGGTPTTLTVSPVVDPQNPLQVSQILTGLLPSTTYSVTVVANCAGGAVSAPLTTSFTTPAGTVTPAGPAPANDNCTGAALLAVGATCAPTAGTTVDATASAAGMPLPDCAGNPAPADVWYRLLVPASGTVTVRLDSVAGVGLRESSLALYTGSCASLTQLSCATGGVGQGAASASATGIPGSTLYVRVWNEAAPRSIYPVTGPFTICAVDTPPTCPLVTGVTVSAITTTTASVGFVPGAGNVGFSVTATPVGGGASVQESDTSSPIGLTGLLPGTTYLLTVASACGTDPFGPGVQATFTTSTPPVTCPPPAAFYAGSITGTTASINFTPVPGTTYVLTYTASGGTTQTLPVTTAPVALTGLLASTAYTVTLQATCAVGPAPLLTTRFTTTNGCPAPTFTTVTALTSTTATIGFTAPAGAGSYTATLTPAGGASQTVAPPPVGSPFTLTGLTPGTGYTLALRSTCSGTTASAPDTVRFVTLTPVTACAAPAAVTAIAGAGGTTATVQFTGPTGAVGYTVTATPTAGGNPVTAAAPASPVALTGLLPGTAYTVSVTTNCGAGTGSIPTSGIGFTTPLASRNTALAAALILFPNPAQRKATLLVPAALLRQAGQLTITDAMGRTIQQRYLMPASGSAPETRMELDLSGLPAGVYWLRLLSSVGPLTKQLVIE
jgi:hypothetical protein